MQKSNSEELLCYRGQGLAVDLWIPAAVVQRERAAAFAHVLGNQYSHMWHLCCLVWLINTLSNKLELSIKYTAHINCPEHPSNYIATPWGHCDLVLHRQTTTEYLSLIESKRVISCLHVEINLMLCFIYIYIYIYAYIQVHLNTLECRGKVNLFQ